MSGFKPTLRTLLFVLLGILFVISIQGKWTGNPLSSLLYALISGISFVFGMWLIPDRWASEITARARDLRGKLNNRKKK